MERRRLFAALLAAAFASRALAQATRVRVVGYLIEGDGYPNNFARRMAELGYVEGRNLRIVVARAPKVMSGEHIDRAVAELIAAKP